DEIKFGEKDRSRSTDGVCPSVAGTSARTFRPDLTLEELCRRCAPTHRNSRRETAGWDRIDRQEVFVHCWKAELSPNVGSAKGTGRERLKCRVQKILMLHGRELCILHFKLSTAYAFSMHG